MANTELSEFFSLVSQEKNENKTRLKEELSNKESDLASLFRELELAHKETVKISEEVSEEENLTEEDQNKLETFSDLVDSLDTPIEPVEVVEPEPPIEDVLVEPVDETEKIAAFEELFKNFTEPPLKDEEIKSFTGYEDESENDYIKEVVSQIAATKPKNPRQTDVYERPITDFQSLQREFTNFKHKVIEQLNSLGGGGSIRINDMEDLDTTGREDGDSLIYNSSTDKYGFSSASTPPDLSNQLSLEDSIDGNFLIDGTDASGSDAGDDFLQESGVNGGRDLDHNILQSLTSDIIPHATATFDLGSETKRFRNLYLESDTVDIGGATISSDGSGTITISADGVTVPVGSKDADGFELARTTADTGQTFKIVKLYTLASGLSTAAASFKFNAELANKAVYTEAGHVFTLSNGNARSDAGVELFQF